MHQFWIALASVFVVVGPLGAVPTFAALTRDRSRAEVASIARRGTIIGAAVLAAFTLLGGHLLAALGVSRHAFQIAGGFLLFLSAIEMLRGKAPTCGGGGPAGVARARREDDIAIVPVAIPLLAGPGSMVTVMSLVSEHPGLTSTIAILAAIVVTFLIAYPVLRSATVVQRVVGASILTVVQRVLGLVLAALSIQTMLGGLAHFLAGVVPLA